MIDDFRGEFYHNLDIKNRLNIPKKFAARLKAEEKGKVVISRGVDRCLWMYPHSTFERIVTEMKKLPLFDPRAQKFQNAFYAGSHDDVVDGANRILMPKHLLDFAQINKEVVLVGSMSRIQIWSLDNWNKHLEHLMMNTNEIANDMSSFFDSLTLQSPEGTV